MTAKTIDTFDLALPDYECPAGRLVTAQSFLIDRFVPDCEHIMLPEKTVAGGSLFAERLSEMTVPAQRQRGLARLRPVAPAQQTKRIMLNLRLRQPQNWAHFLNNHLPVVFCLQAAFDITAQDLVLILPQNTPSYIVEVATLFGFETLVTDGAVTGPAIRWQMTPWTAGRTLRHDWVKGLGIKAVDKAVAPQAPGPTRVFLTRRDTRALSNAPEIEALLKARGFEVVIPETLSAAQQFALFRHADIIVAIHGAGLAPMLYSPAEESPKALVELLPCGHMTDVYRVMADQLNWRWIGVRGRIKPTYVAPAYSLDQRFDAFSLDSFEVDPVSLEAALGLVA